MNQDPIAFMVTSIGRLVRGTARALRLTNAQVREALQAILREYEA